MPRAQEYQGFVYQAGLAAQEYGVDPNVLIAQLNYESSFNANAQGAAGEVGIGQFMPDTWRMVIRQHPELVEKFGISEDPATRSNGNANIWAAAAHMGDLLRMFNGDIATALAGYNGGAGGTQGAAAQRYAAAVLGRVGVTHENEFENADRVPGVAEGGPGPPFETPAQRASETWVRLLGTRIREEEAKGNHRRALALQEVLDGYLTAREGDARTHELALAYVHSDLRIKEDAARDLGDRETQRLMKELQAEIDAEARRQNFDNDKWMLEKRQAFDAAEAEKGRSFSAEQSALDRENQQKGLAITELGALKRQLIDTKQRANEFLAQMVGQDPLRAAASLQGRVQRGRTPADVVRSKLETAAATPLPTIDPNATLPALQAQIATTAPQAGMPTITPTLGLAGGGVIEMTRNKLGKFGITPDSPRPDLGGNTGIGIIVGDGEHGEGIKAGTAELMEIQDNGRIRVIPIATRGAGGLEIDTRLGTSGLGAPTTRRSQRAPIGPVTRPIPRPDVPSAVAFRGRSGAAAFAPEPTVAQLDRAPSFGAALPQVGAAAPQIEAGVAPSLSVAGAGLQGAGGAGLAVEQPFEPADLLALLGRFPDVTAQDVLWLRQYAEYWGGFPGNDATVTMALTVADIYNRLIAGLITETEAGAEIRALTDGAPPGVEPPPGEEPPPGVEPPPEELPYQLPTSLPPLPQGADAQAVITFLTELLSRDAGLWTIQDAQWFYGRGMQAIGEVIANATLGGIDSAAAVSLLTGYLNGLSTAGVDGGDGVDVEGLRRAIQDLYNDLGIPLSQATTTTGVFGSTRFGQGDVPTNEFLTRFGLNPQLVRDSTTGQVFVVENGQLIPITAVGAAADSRLQALGIRPEDIISLHPSELRQFGTLPEGTLGGQQISNEAQQLLARLIGQIQQGSFTPDLINWALDLVNVGLPGLANAVTQFINGEMTEQELMQAAVAILEGEAFSPVGTAAAGQLLTDTAPSGGFPSPVTPLIEPNTGMLLPAIRKVAALWPRLDLVTRDLLISAYSLAGYGDSAEANLNRELDFFSLRGTFNPSQVAAFG